MEQNLSVMHFNLQRRNLHALSLLMKLMRLGLNDLTGTTYDLPSSTVLKYFIYMFVLSFEEEESRNLVWILNGSHYLNFYF